MASYFHGNSEIQGGNDGLQTLILMNPSYVGFSETQQQPPGGGSSNNIIFFNSNPHAPPPPPPSQQFVGVPLATTAFTAPSQAAGNTTNNNNNNEESISALHGFLGRSSQYGFYNPANDITAAREMTRAHHQHQQQGLSLSLSSSQQSGFGNFTAAREIVSSPTASASGVVLQQQIQSFNMPLSSKYLKAAQELLDEVVNVGKSMKTISNNSTELVNDDVKKSKNMATTMTDMDGNELDRGENSSKHDSGGGGGGGGGTAAELSTAERQEIQMKKAKLLNMLDEVEQRYRHYHHQMQTVIRWLEQAAGIGSAKTYTALALQTISKQFRCLKDAIIGQIRSASQTLGEEDSLGGKIEGSRLKFVDNQLRQQRALQQLGMIQQCLETSERIAGTSCLCTSRLAL